MRSEAQVMCKRFNLLVHSKIRENRIPSRGPVTVSTTNGEGRVCVIIDYKKESTELTFQDTEIQEGNINELAEKVLSKIMELVSIENRKSHTSPKPLPRGASEWVRRRIAQQWLSSRVDVA